MSARIHREVMRGFCEQHADETLGWMVGSTSSELLINTVNRKEPKLLTGFDQKVYGRLFLLHLGIR